jgi:ATP-dependent protease Clp ATPase subunit
MMKPMYELPSRADVERVIVTKGYVLGNEEIRLVLKAENQALE